MARGGTSGRLSSGVHLPALDGLRGVAILSVMIFHWGQGRVGATKLARLFFRGLHCGWLGVDLFFVLSGFLITGILLDSRGEDGYFKNFVMRRVLRIFPLYYGALFFVFLLLPWFQPEAVGALAGKQAWLWLYSSNFGLVHYDDWVFSTDWVWLNHFWSLSVEEHYYLAWPAVVWALGPKRLGAMCGALIVLALGLRIGCYFLGDHRMAAYVLTPCRMDGLAAGGLLAVLARREVGLAPLTTAAKIAVTSGALLVAGLWYQTGFAPTVPVIYTLGFTIALTMFCGWIVLGLGAPKESVVGRVLGSRFLSFFGKYSYGLYVFHLIWQPVLDKLAPPERLAASLGGSPTLGLLASFALAFAVNIATALASWNLFEKRFLSLKRFFAHKSHAAS